MKHSLAVIAMAITAVLATSAPAIASVPSARAHRFGSCRSSGDFAICIASGTAHHPGKIRVHVGASPRQRVTVSWNMVCSRGLSAASKSGQFTARTRINRVMRHPFRRPDTCIVAAGGQLAGRGRLHVWLTYTRA